LNVAQIAAGAVFGESGGKLVAAIISAGLVSALSAMVWTGPRVAMVLAEDHPRFFGIFRHRNADGIPVNAVVAQSALTLLLLLTATFEQVLVYTQLALLACGLLVVLGLMILRHREPALPRPFRVPLYPLTPLLFLAISAFALVYTAVSRPFEAVCGAVTMLVCLLLYFPARSRRDPAQ
ncbi:MAG: amino acid permease, partial [Chthoniobacterales bacterium]